MDQQIWRWTLTKEAIAPCFVRDVLAMRRHNKADTDFFWLGHTPCRTVVLVGMVVGIQAYEKRTIYTIDDGTAVIDCVIRHPHPALPVPAPRLPPRPTGGPGTSSDPQRSPPKKPRLDKAKSESTEPPPPITEPGYPVRVVGRVARHYQSKQIHADTINLCPSSLDEIAHLERVVELHKTRYSLAVPFVVPPKPPRSPPHDASIRHANDADTNVFSDTLPLCPSTTSYTIPAPPIPMPFQSRNRPPPVQTHLHSSYHDHTHIPSSPTASSIVSSTPSSPSKPTSPVKVHETPLKPKLRHPSRLHTRDLTGNTFRLYVKHYMDNAPPPFLAPLSSPSRSTCERVTTPTKHARDADEPDDPTPRPRLAVRNTETEEDDGLTLGFTLSHLRRVPELALLAARVVRAETRKRDKAKRERERETSHSRIPSSSSTSALARREENRVPADPPHKKMKRLFSWAVVKLHEEGSIVLWDGDVRPLPMPPPPVLERDIGQAEERNGGGLWRQDATRSTFGDSSVSCSRSYTLGDPFSSTSSSTCASVLYTSSASASLYSHYHPPRRSAKCPSGSERRQADRETDADVDADPGSVSDPGVDEEAYVPLTPHLLAGYVREAVGALHRGRKGGVGRGAGAGARATEPTAEDILAYLKRTDERWARVGAWTVEEALAVLKAR